MKKTLKCIAIVALLSVSSFMGACGGKNKNHTHSFGDWTIVTPATHTSVGKEVRTCDCGETEEREIPKTTEHEWGEWVVVTPPTHTSLGLERRTCPCGETEEREIPKTTEHNYVETERDEASYLNDGSVTYTCACGDSYTLTIPSFQSTIEDMSITYFDTETLLAEVTVTLDDESTLVFEDLITEEDENNPDLHKIVVNVSNLKVVKSVTGFFLKDAKDFLSDIAANCTCEWHIHSYSNGVCRCGEETFRMTIKDIFSITDKGIVIEGMVEGASINLNDEVLYYNGTEFVTYTIAGIEKFKKDVESANPGESIGVLLAEAESVNEFSRGSLLVTEEGNWTPKTSVNGICELSFRRTPAVSGYSPNFYIHGQVVTGTIMFPKGVELFKNTDRLNVTVNFTTSFLALDRAEYIVRDSSRTVGYFVTNYESDELGTFVPAVSVKYPSTPGATPSDHTISEGHYIDENGNEYNDLALLESTEVNHYDFFIGITGALKVAGRGIIVSSTLAPYDELGIVWEVNVQVEVLIGKTCTLLVYDAEQSKTVEMERIIIGAASPNEGVYEFLLRGFDITNAQNTIAMYIA